VLVQSIVPAYSDEALRLRMQGTTELMIVVREDGSVGGTQATKRLGYGFEERAVEAIKQWKFRPAQKDGQAVAVNISVAVNFTLQSGIALPAVLGTTDSAGSAVLNNLSNGRFVIVGKRDGLIGIAPAIVPANQPVVLDLVAGSSVRGKVRDSTGAPLPGVWVNLGFSSDQGGQRVFIEGARTLTNAAGEYSFASVLPGDFYLRAQGSSSTVYYPASSALERAVSIPVGAGREVVGIDIEVPAK
jgi:TonB family protein